MNALSPFYYGHKEIRTVQIGNDIWFVAKDICEGLDIAWSSRTLDPIKAEWKRVMNLITPRGKQDLAVISEAESLKPKNSLIGSLAKSFRRFARPANTSRRITVFCRLSCIQMSLSRKRCPKRFKIWNFKLRK